jgi:hypothetical protein
MSRTMGISSKGVFIVMVLQMKQYKVQKYGFFVVGEQKEVEKVENRTNTTCFLI